MVEGEEGHPAFLYLSRVFVAIRLSRSVALRSYLTELQFTKIFQGCRMCIRAVYLAHYNVVSSMNLTILLPSNSPSWCFPALASPSRYSSSSNSP